YGRAMLDALSEAARERGLDTARLGDPRSLPDTAASEIAHAVQALTESTLSEAISGLRAGLEMSRGTCPEALCLSGGVSLNCPANSRIAARSGFRDVHVEPHCEDGGISIGAASYMHHHLLGRPRLARSRPTSRQAMLGPGHAVEQQLEA